MDLMLPIIFIITPIYGSCYRVMDSSNIQEFFLSDSIFLSCHKQKALEVRKDNEKKIINIKIKKLKIINKINIVLWSCCSKRFLCDIHCFTFFICDFVSQFNAGVN